MKDSNEKNKANEKSITSISILQSGNIYFFYRPKIEYSKVHGPEEAQKFFTVLKPEKTPHYITLVVGRKHLPLTATYFSFVENISANMNILLDTLKKQHYKTSTHGEREISPARCLGAGKYLLIDHEQHVHLCYQLNAPSKIREIQEQFNLKDHGDYLVSVKNPSRPSPASIGLSSTQNANYPQKLQKLFGNYKFLPLNPPEFMNYEGAELLLIGKETSDIEERGPKIKKCLKSIPGDDLLQYFKNVQDPDTFPSFV